MSTRRRFRLTVRDRILAAVLVMTALALIASGGTAWYFQRERVDNSIDVELRQTIAELNTLATTGIDPETGEPFVDADRLLHTMMSRKAPGTTEGMIAFVGDHLRFETADIGLPLADDPEFVAEVAGTWQQDRSWLKSVTTPVAEYRYAAIPVQVGDTPPGALVVAHDRGLEQGALTSTFVTYGIVAGGALLVLAVVGWVIAGRLLRPLRALRETAEQITDSDLSRRIPADGDDDISDLARTFNDMLTRLEISFSSQRRLLDDAGHELRTPITIVRGHLELMDPSDPQDAAATRELTLSELDRMHRLADDLVMLAKADAPGFVQPVRTEVGTLLDNVLDQARRLGPRRWRINERVEATANLDPQRITQAMLQLAANAVKFSPAGSTVTIGSRIEDGTLALWVRDEGTGIPVDEQATIFERFTRGTTASGSQIEGSGLGLSIVAAITESHGGQVRVDSAPGLGARFTLWLPASDAELDESPDDEIVVDDDNLEIAGTTPAVDAGSAPHTGAARGAHRTDEGAP
ncbi:sensor histidine kinase [Georgenia sunbinii]|uniref:sensor histidine kinase n=1 Tax=Georgenia sunbinii TaxID=3117728 RepID=UPI002F26CDDE